MNTKANTELLQQMQEENKILMQMIENLKLEMRQGKRQVDRKVIDEQLAVLHDPFFSQDPYKTMGLIPPDENFPDGQVLWWANPRYRSRRGWKGLVPMEWNDPYLQPDPKKKLAELIPDPPTFMKGPDQVDNYIRRGDSVLARIDKRIFDSRRRMMELLSARDRGALESQEDQILGPGQRITGKGLERDENPRFDKPQDVPHRKWNEKTGEGSHRTELLKE